MSACIKEIRGAMIVAPQFPDALVHRVFFVMQAYLTNGWRLSFTHAAAIMNIWEGTSLVLPCFFQFLANKYLRNLKVAVISAISSSVGIGMVALSVPKILDYNGGRCLSTEAESCLNATQRGVFFTGMVLTAIGRAGISFSLDALHDEINQSSSNCLHRAVKNYIDFVAWADKLFIYLIGSLLVMIWIKKWKLLFGIPAIYSACMTIWFLCGFLLYKPKPSVGNGDEIAEDQNPCSSDEIVKFVVRMVPISLTFIVCWIVSSFGNTYFVEQANRMNRRVGNWNVPLLALQLPVIIFKAFHDFYLYLFFKCKDWIGKKLKIDSALGEIAAIWGIGVAMSYSVLCCITAAKMEMKRLKVLEKHDLFDKPDDVVIPMHAAWLLFQFFLLAGVDSLLRKCVEEFYKDQAPQRLKDKLEAGDGKMKRYLISAVDFVSGLGFLYGVFLVFVVGKLSEIGGKPNWFHYTLNKSRLDRYYWVLAALSAVNLIVFSLLALKYVRVKRMQEGRT